MASPVFFVRPRTVPAINWNHPLAKDLVFLFIPEVGELLSGTRPVALSGTATIKSAQFGPCLDNPDASSATNTAAGSLTIPAGSRIYSVSQSITIFAEMIARGTAATSTKVISKDDGASTNQIGFGFGNTTASQGRFQYSNAGVQVSVLSATGYWIQDEFHAYAMTRDFAGGKVNFHRDGLFFDGPADGSAASLAWEATRAWGFLGRGSTSATQGVQGDVGLIYMFGRALSDIEHLQLAANPLGLLDYGTDLPLAVLGATPASNYVPPQPPQKIGGPTPISRFRSQQAFLAPDPPPPPGSASFWRLQAPRVGFGAKGPFSGEVRPQAYLVSSVGPTVYDDTLTESVSAADSLVAVQVFVEASFSEAAAAADALSTQQVFVEGGFTESVSAADSLASSGIWASVIAEAGGAADTLSSAAIFPNSLTEAAAASDAVSGGLLFTEAPSEAVNAAEALTQMQVFAPTLAEAVAAADTLIGEGGSDVVPGLGMASLLWWQAWQRRGAVYDEVIAEDVWSRAGWSVRPVFRNASAARVDAHAGVDSSLVAKARLREAAKVRDLVRSRQTYDEELVELVVAVAEFRARTQIRTALAEQVAATIRADASLTVRARIGESVAAVVTIAGGIWFTRAVNESVMTTDVLAAAGYFNPSDEQIALALLLLDP